MKQEPISLVSFQYLFMRYYNQQYSQFTDALAQEAERHFVFSFFSSDSRFMNIVQFRDERGSSEWNVNGHDSWR